jgi:hypothetical protein
MELGGLEPPTFWVRCGRPVERSTTRFWLARARCPPVPENDLERQMSEYVGICRRIWALERS